MNQPEIPFLDIFAHHEKIEDDLVQIFRNSLRTSSFIGGPLVSGFEEDFARYIGTQAAIGVNSGTDALRFALIAMGIGQGDVVITVPNTFIATTEAISQTGARIQFVDVNKSNGLMDIQKLTDMVRKAYASGAAADRPKAIVPVHLYGQCVDMDPVLALAKEFGMKVLEDACQAHGAKYKGRMAGTMGDAAAFSFYPGKNLGALGEGGAITTNDPKVAEICRMLRDHGQNKKYYHTYEGYNGRLDAIQAGFLRAKLPHLDQWNSNRRRAAQFYDESFARQEWIQPVKTEAHNEPVYHLYVIHTAFQQPLFDHMKAQGIHCGYHYPKPLHLQECYKRLGHKEGDFPTTELLASQLLSLPMYPSLTSEALDRVAKAVTSFKRA